MCPVLFKIGPFALYTYGLTLAIAFLAATAFIYRQAKNRGIDTGKLADLGFFVILAGIVGSRILFVLMYPAEYIRAPLKILKLWEGGLVFYGGILGGVIATIVLIKRYALPFWKTLDILAPALALAQAIGRMGCFMAGCCYGRPTDLPWGVVFTNPNSLAPLGMALHPTQLYHSLANLTVFLILFSLLRKGKRASGQIFALYLCLYGLGRFFVEFFRGDWRIVLIDHLNLTQLISLLLVLGGVILYRLLGLRRT
ncbi:MAG: prolipoprotein diacylglyceryl transferase [bacterium]